MSHPVKGNKLTKIIFKYLIVKYVFLEKLNLLEAHIQNPYMITIDDSGNIALYPPIQI